MRSLSILLVLALGASATKKPCPPPPCPANQIMKGGHCVPACRDGEILLNNHQCVCGPGTEKDKKGACQPKCPDGTKKDEKGTCQPIKSPPGPIVCPDGTKKDEPIPCPKGMVLINSHCQCPDPSMKWINNDCQCPDSQVFHEGKCVCLPGMEKDAKGTCQTTCPPGPIVCDYGMEKNEKGICQPIPCPKGMMYINYHCQCPDPSMKWFNNDCHCPDQQYLLEGRCVCLPGMEKSANGTCIPKCPPGTDRLANGSCSHLHCLEGQFEVNGHCVWRPCPNNLERIGNKCGCKLPAVEVREDPCGDSKCFTPPCPRGEVRQTNGTCVEFCKDGYILVKGVCTCHLPHEKPICGDGERLDSNIDECVCKDGLTRQHPDYTCKPPKQLGGPAKCPSGIETGKCYTFTFPNGQLLGFNHKSDSYIASNTQTLFGKFSLCTTIECAPNLPIEAGTSFNIHDLIQGDLGQGRKSWLSSDSDGAYITRTPRWEEAADFVIVKWPGGKHCLGGLESGVGLIKADDGGSVGATMLTMDDQSCVLVTVTEVPCDIRAETANCFGGNKTETSVSSPAASKVANASMPIDGSGVSGHH